VVPAFSARVQAAAALVITAATAERAAYGVLILSAEEELRHLQLGVMEPHAVTAVEMAAAEELTILQLLAQAEMAERLEGEAEEAVLLGGLLLLEAQAVTEPEAKSESIVGR